MSEAEVIEDYMEDTGADQQQRCVVGRPRWETTPPLLKARSRQKQLRPRLRHLAPAPTSHPCRHGKGAPDGGARDGGAAGKHGLGRGGDEQQDKDGAKRVIKRKRPKLTATMLRVRLGNTSGWVVTRAMMCRFPPHATPGAPWPNTRQP